jgi:hypothetical protein
MLGGVQRFITNWKIASSDLTEQPRWLHEVPQTRLVEAVGTP